jgi:hypothetical protein
MIIGPEEGPNGQGRIDRGKEGLVPGEGGKTGKMLREEEWGIK